MSLRVWCVVAAAITILSSTLTAVNATEMEGHHVLHDAVAAHHKHEDKASLKEREEALSKLKAAEEAAGLHKGTLEEQVKAKAMQQAGMGHHSEAKQEHKTTVAQEDTAQTEEELKQAASQGDTSAAVAHAVLDAKHGVASALKEGMCHNVDNVLAQFVQKCSITSTAKDKYSADMCTKVARMLAFVAVQVGSDTHKKELVTFFQDQLEAQQQMKVKQEHAEKQSASQHEKAQFKQDAAMTALDRALNEDMQLSKMTDNMSPGNPYVSETNIGSKVHMGDLDKDIMDESESSIRLIHITAPVVGWRQFRYSYYYRYLVHTESDIRVLLGETSTRTIKWSYFEHILQKIDVHISVLLKWRQRLELHIVKMIHCTKRKAIYIERIEILRKEYWNLYLMYASLIRYHANIYEYVFVLQKIKIKLIKVLKDHCRTIDMFMTNFDIVQEKLGWVIGVIAMIADSIPVVVSSILAHLHMMIVGVNLFVCVDNLCTIDMNLFEKITHEEEAFMYYHEAWAVLKARVIAMKSNTQVDIVSMFKDAESHRNRPQPPQPLYQ